MCYLRKGESRTAQVSTLRKTVYVIYTCGLLCEVEWLPCKPNANRKKILRRRCWATPSSSDAPLLSGYSSGLTHKQTVSTVTTSNRTVDFTPIVFAVEISARWTSYRGPDLATSTVSPAQVGSWSLHQPCKGYLPKLPLLRCRSLMSIHASVRSVVGYGRSSVRLLHRYTKRFDCSCLIQ